MVSGELRLEAEGHAGHQWFFGLRPDAVYPRGQCWRQRPLSGDQAHPQPSSAPKPQRRQLFISYSHRDTAWVERLRTMLRPLEQRYGLERWDDSRIQAGMVWREEIEKALGSAQVALLMVSADFLASDFVTREELPELFHAARKEGLRILWVPLRPCLWKDIPEIEQYQAAIPPARTLAQMAEVEQEEAFVQIAQEIKRAFQEEAQRRAREKEERERQEAERQAESERQEAERLALEEQKLQRQEAERVARGREEQERKAEEERLADEKEEHERREAERLLRQRQEADRAAHEQNLERYAREFRRAIGAQYPLDSKLADRLKQFQQQLELSDEDVTQIEKPMLESKKEECRLMQVEDQVRQRREVERANKESAKRLMEEQVRQARDQKELQRQEEKPLARVLEYSKVLPLSRRQLLIAAATAVPVVALGVIAGKQGQKQAKQTEPRVFATTTGWLVRQGNRWEKKTRPIEAQGYGEELAPGVLMALLKIPGGRFLMGSPADELQRSDDEGPQHEVSLRAFFLGQTPITQAQWKVVAGWGKVERDLDPDPSRFKGSDRPVEKVSWHEAVEFCRRLSARTGRTYTLPSEAQWEYACRAGTTTPFAFGETISPELANYNGNYAYGDGPKGDYRQQTTPVGSFPANAWGLNDMHGNVWEWCLDAWHGSNAGAPIDGSPWLDPKPGEGAERLLRGGSWYNNPRYCRSACRDRGDPDGRDSDLGFRVCCLPPGLPS